MLPSVWEKKEASCYTQTGVSIPMNLYIHFVISAGFLVLKEFVSGPSTHVSLF